MPHIDDAQLRALRLKINASQAQLALLLGISRRTITRWENTGDISDRHLSQLLSAAGGAPLPDAPKGRPVKAWRRFNPGRHWQGYRYVKNGDNYRGDGARPKQWLWRPGHPEHGLSLDSYPTGVGDSWTEETDKYGTTRIRYAIDDGGCHYQVEIMEDYFTKLTESGFKDKDITKP